MKKKVGIIDYGVGNTASVSNTVNFLNYRTIISKDIEVLSSCDLLILPGVGAFNECFANFEKTGIIDDLKTLVITDKKPILGICVGMQLLATTSTENGLHRGLNWIPGKVVEIKSNQEFKVPHVGWSQVKINREDTIFNRFSETPYFYFDHSYHFECDNREHITSSVNYSDLSITASVNKDNVWGVQFHPEKSQLSGLRLIKGLVERDIK